ncbi:hypothetical protein LDENG_00161960, partial [Lucifuga dentata]
CFSSSIIKTESSDLISHTSYLYRSYIDLLSTGVSVILDCDLTFELYVKKLVQSCFFQLRSVAKIKPMFSYSNLEKVIHSLIFSRLDYCNSLLSGINQKLISRLQQVQNAAARLLPGSNRWQRITPVLASLHWLPVHFRIDFKILIITFKAHLGLPPTYICDMLISYEPAAASDPQALTSLLLPILT